jgi:ABC-type thiamine transport system ATPase subunit
LDRYAALKRAIRPECPAWKPASETAVERGITILMISRDMEEIRGTSNRGAVLHE